MVLVVGFFLLSARDAQLGPRATALARAGLATLALDLLLQSAWAATQPWLWQSYLSPSEHPWVVSGVGTVLSVIFAVGVGVLVAAVLARGGPRGFGAADSHPGVPGGLLTEPPASPAPDSYTPAC